MSSSREAGKLGARVMSGKTADDAVREFLHG
jgi:hypothetical protein